MTFIDRIGIDVQAKLPLEEAVAWAIAHGLRYIEAEADVTPNAFERFDEALCERISAQCTEHGISLGLHTLSSVNTAEISPFVSPAVDAYLQGYVDLARRLGAKWIVVHAGYHFGDQQARMHASLERLLRVVAYAEHAGAKLLLENLNWEPDLAEVHYLAHSIEECLYFFDRIDSPSLGWSFTVNHATLEPEGIEGFIDALPMSRCGEVRLADNNGKHEVHMFPGDGMIDFGKLFSRLESLGYISHYMCNFGTLEDMLRGRQRLGEAARAAGVADA
ncbi:MAG: sugar phosphate isomerase/epimerase [Gammaproteobacteria bacterium]|nr:sugar phosphate isomerase/epimerase [Gammaproteobacteria bacterium]